MFLTKKYLVCAILVFIFSVILSLFPLIGVLGFEYAVFSSVFLSFIAVFISAEAINDSLNKSYINFNTTDFLSKLFLVNLIFVAINFIVGFISSLINKDCSLESGIYFYVLIPLISVVYSMAIGSFAGLIFRKRGFLVGSLILIITILLSLYELYSQTHIFFFNPIIGYFPGSVYDKFIPVTSTLIVYRLIILGWAILIFTLLNIYQNYKKGFLDIATFILLIFLLILLVFSNYKEENIGIRYSRDYIQNNVLTKTYETEHFLIHYDPESDAAKNIELIAKDHEWRYSEVSEYLDVDIRDKIISYIYPDSQVRKKYFGSLHATVANPIHREIHQVFNTYPIGELKHELVHIISADFGTRTLKISPKKGLIEGIAVAVDWPVNVMDKHQLSKTLLNKESLNKNLSDFLGYGFWYYPPSVSYTLMGSYSRYLLDNFGVEKFKEYYRTGSTDKYNKSEEELLTSWVNYLNNEIELPDNADKFSEYKFSDKSIFEDSCPRKTDYYLSEGFKDYASDNFYGSTSDFEKANELNPHNPNIKSALAYSYYFNKDYDKLLNLNTEGLTKIDINIINNLKANVLWDREGYEYAYPHFVKLKVRSLPNDIQRSIDLKIDLKRFNKNIKNAYKNFLLTNDTIEKIAILEDLKQRYRSYVPSYYLLGRIYLRQGNFKRAIEHLEFSEIRRLPGDNLRMENLRSLGVAQYSAGDYYGAIKTFDKLARMDEKGGEFKSYAANFIDRANWELNN